MDIYWLCFLGGILLSYPIRSIFLSFSRKMEKQNRETKWTFNSIIVLLGMVFIIAGYAFTLHSDYLTSLQGSGNENVIKATGENMTQYFAGQVAYFNDKLVLYDVLIYAIFGIIIGLVLCQIGIWIRGWFKRKKQISDDSEVQQWSVALSKQDLSNTVNHIKELRQVFKELGTFFKNLADDKDDKPKE